MASGGELCVWLTGQQRSRMLATLFKDERCQQLPAYGILEKMYALSSEFYFISIAPVSHFLTHTVSKISKSVAC